MDGFVLYFMNMFSYQQITDLRSQIVTSNSPQFPLPRREGIKGRGKYLKERGTMGNTKALVPPEVIVTKIIFLRGEKVLLDRDLAELYGVETRVLKQAVRRNIKRFPEDFMFELTEDENRALRSQNVTLKRGQHSKYLPFAFTEQGVAMLSSVLNSERAIEMNIAIMRAFVQLRKMIASNEELARKLDELEEKYDEQFRIVFDAIRALIDQDEKPRKKIGFEVSEGRVSYRKKKKQ
jgi:phage regulator Rha-like protein